MMLRISRSLVRRAQRGDAGATEEVVIVCRALFWRVLSSRGLGGDARDDISQQSLAAVLESLCQYQGKASFETWALSILFRMHARCQQQLSRVHSRELLEADMDPDRTSELETTCDPKSDPALHATRNALREALCDCLSRIAIEMREVWVRHRLWGHEHHDIARDLGVKMKTVGTRIHRVDGHLRGCLGGKGFTPASIGTGR